MIGPYFAPAPNGHKITLFLEEAELGYRLIKVDLGKGGQLRPESLRISLNNKIPAIIDHSPIDDDEPLSPSESNAILLYLTEKTGPFLNHGTRERVATLQWLFWQAGGLGPIPGQNHYFNYAAPQTVPYAIERYQVEAQCLCRILSRRLESSPWLGNESYSVVGIACRPWVNAWIRQWINLAVHPAVRSQHEWIRSHPTTGQALLKAQLGDERLGS